MPKVSVIIPFHNTEKYLERCARSLFNQTLDDIEFVFVNDCSTDKSSNIINDVLREYPERCSQTIFLNNETNLGSSLSRFQALSVAKGEYIIACDADDYVESKMYELMYLLALCDDADMVTCDFDWVYPDGRHIQSPPQKPSESFLMDLLTGRSFNFLWNKLIKRSIFECAYIRPSASVWEDVAIISQLAYYCKKVSAINIPLYHYYVNPGSLMNGVQKEKRVQDMIENVKIVEEFLKQKDLLPKYSSALIRHKGYVLSELFDSPRADYLKEFPEIRYRLFFSPYVSFQNKLGHLTKLLGIHGISKYFHKF